MVPPETTQLADQGVDRAADGPDESVGSGATPRERLILEVALYVLTLVATVVGMYVLFHLELADLRVLMRNMFDSRFVAESVKGFIEHGSFSINPSVGAPGGLNMLDWPSTDGLNYLVLGLIALVAKQAALSVNLYYLLGYPLAAVSAVFVLRRFGVSRSAAMVVGVLFAFIPYHYLRGTAHLFLSSYYVIPLAVMLALQLDSARFPFFAASDEHGAAGRFKPLTWSALGFAAIALCAGLSGAYYALFTCFFLLVAGAYAGFRSRSWKRFASAAILIAITVATVVVQMIPTWIYHAQAGPNTLAVGRIAAEADIYGFRLSQLILPMPVHRFDIFSRLIDPYWGQLYSIVGKNESYFSALGVLGSIGFLALLGWLVFARLRPQSGSPRFARLMSLLSVLALAAFLLGTVGGIGALGGLVTSLIRCYNRVSVFLSFFSLFAFALLLDRVFCFLERKRVSRIIITTLCLAPLAFGLADQVAPGYQIEYRNLAATEASDAAIVGQLESALPKDSMVFQLPYLAFPEGGSMAVWPHDMSDYQHFRAPLQSKTLRWSYGAMKGREGDAWEQTTAALPVPEMVDQLKAQGFRAVWVDRMGYEDDGAALETQLAKATGSQALVSPDGQIAAFIIK